MKKMLGLLGALSVLLAPATSVAQLFPQTETFSNYVNGLPLATVPGTADQLYIRQGGTSKQLTIAQFLGISPVWTGSHQWTGAAPQLTLGQAGGNAGQLTLNGSIGGASSVLVSSTGGLAFQTQANNGFGFRDAANGNIFILENGNPGINVANQITINGNSTGNAPSIQATGTDNNIPITLTPKGSGSVASPNYTATAAAPTVSSGQVGYGGTTVAAGSGTCPTGSVGGSTVQGCIVVNIAGTSRNVPFF